jgi:hypothetical protein
MRWKRGAKMKKLLSPFIAFLFSLALLTQAQAADVCNTGVFSQTDASNGSGTMPSWSGSAAPSTIDDAGRALQGALTRTLNWSNYTVTSSGSANAYVVTYAVAPAAYCTGWRYSYITNFAVTGSATVNINTLGAKTIKKDVAGVLTALSSGDMASGQFVELAYNGTDMIWVNWQGASTAVPTANSTTEVLTGTDTTKFTTADSGAALWEKGSDIASAGTITVGEGGTFDVTGTTTITDIDPGTDKAGRTFRLVHEGIHILTHNATTMINLTGANITTAAGDISEWQSEGADAVRMTKYSRADGTALVASAAGITLATEQATTSSTSKDFTGIPAGTKRITVMLDGVSTNGTSDLMVQLGDSGGFEATGYIGSGTSIGTAANTTGAVTAFTTGFNITIFRNAADLVKGQLIINLQDASNTWVGTAIATGSAAGLHAMNLTAAMKQLSAELTQVRFTTVNGTDTFDAGSVNISYE